MGLFEILPSELIQDIFSYLWADEIVHSFHGLNEYLNCVIRNYDQYIIRLGPMIKNQFNLMCEVIQPLQIKSVVFANENDTPQQFKIFFSHFPMENLANIRSFALLSYDEDVVRKQILPLCQKYRFRSIAAPNIHQFCWPLSEYIIEPNISRLRLLWISSVILEKRMENLRHLTITHCFPHRVTDTLSKVPNLRSLNVTMTLDKFPCWTKQIPMMNFLKKFFLTIRGSKKRSEFYLFLLIMKSIHRLSLDGRMTISQMTEILTKLPRLTHFELDLEERMEFSRGEKWRRFSQRMDLDIEGATDIVDGNQWKYLVSHLHRFDFRFRLLSTSNEHLLESYRTPFWLNEKKWIVVLQNTTSSSLLFTVPRFVPKNVYYTFDYCSPCSSSPLLLSSDYFHSYVEHLVLPRCRPLTDRFLNVTSLNFETNDQFEENHLLSYLSLPKLSSLSMNAFSLLTTLPSSISFAHIRALVIIKKEISEESMKQLCEIFPNLEYLQVSVDNNQTLIFAIDHLNRLSIAKFLLQPSSPMAAFKSDEIFPRSIRLTTNPDYTYSFNNRQLTIWMTSI